MPCCGAYVSPVHRWHGVCPGRDLWLPGGHAPQRDPSGVIPGRQPADYARKSLLAGVQIEVVLQGQLSAYSDWPPPHVVAAQNPYKEIFSHRSMHHSVHNGMKGLVTAKGVEQLRTAAALVWHEEMRQCAFRAAAVRAAAQAVATVPARAQDGVERSVDLPKATASMRPSTLA